MRIVVGMGMWSNGGVPQREQTVGHFATSSARDCIRGTAPLVVGVIVGFNHSRWLELCLRTLMCSDYPRLRLIYVDNTSTDGSPELVRDRCPAVEVVVTGTNIGFSGGSNRGIERALEIGGEYVLLVNPDTVTPPALVRRLVEFLATHRNYGIVGPLQRDPGSSSLNAWTVHALENGERHVFHHWEPALPSEAGPPEGRALGTLEHAYIQGAAMLVRASALREVGAFDEHYHSFYEDVDLCRRVRRAGHRVALLLDASIEHEGGSNSACSRYRSFHMTRNRMLYMLSDPAIPPPTAMRLTVRWLVDDVTRQLPDACGTVSDVGGLAAAWLSIARSGPWACRARRRIRTITAASELARER